MILVDHSEPGEIVSLLKQSAPVTVMPLNQTHRSDYYFGGEDGKTRQFSRKQAGELLANIDEAEDQLRDYYNNADENYQIVEGIILPGKAEFGDIAAEEISIRPYSVAHPATSPPRNTLVSYGVSPTSFIYNMHAHNVGMPLLAAWLFQLSQVGVVTFFTASYVETAQLIAAIYRNCQKPPDEHTTLNRYIKPRIYIKEHNPYVETLMGLKGAELGEVKAKALIGYFGSPLSLFMATVEEICQVEGFGRKTAEKILKSIGREE